MRCILTALLVGACACVGITGCSASSPAGRDDSEVGRGGDGDGDAPVGAAGDGAGAAPPTSAFDNPDQPMTPPPAVMPPADDGMPADSCSATSAEAEIKREGVDVIWVVDNSGSMLAETQAVQRNMNRFADTLFNMGIDVRLVLISASSVATPDTMCAPEDFLCAINGIVAQTGLGICISAPFGSGMCPLDSNPPSFTHLDVPVGSRNALQLVMDTYPQYQAMLRPDTTKHFVVVSDDNSQVGAAPFTQWVDGLDPTLFSNGWFFHGVFALSSCLDAASVGTVYQTLTTQTGGVASDLCSQDFDPVFDTLATEVAKEADIACEWAIPPAPPGETLDPSLVNVTYTQPDGSVVPLGKIPEGEDCDGREGWRYDDPSAPSQVVSCPAACDRFQAAGGKVDVLFGCLTQVVR